MDFRIELPLWKWLVLLGIILAIIAFLAVGAVYGQDRHVVYIPRADSSIEYAARPASLPLPSGYRCFANVTPYARYAGYFYGSCQLNMPNGNPSGVLVYRSRDGSSSEFVLATGKSAGAGQLVVDTDGALVLSYFVFTEQRQYLQVVQP